MKILKTPEKQTENLYRQAYEKRNFILFLSFAAMFISISVKSELISMILTGGCLLAVMIILYRNFTLLIRVTTADIKIGTLKITMAFNMVIFILTAAIIVLDKTALIKMTQSNEKLLGLVIISIIILFGGFISSKLPFNRHTGLRLPWTIHDEDTWNVAHKIIGYISLPLELLYLAAFFTISNFEVISITVILLWISIPGFLSLIFWWKKSYRKLKL